MAAPADPQRFATFVAGPGNAAALTAARAAARRPGEYARLLVITGDTGLGKTHLARAIVHAARTGRPRLRAAYHSSESLFLLALGPWRRGVSALARRLACVDVLVIDDLHRLPARPSTLAAFGATLAAAATRCRQIVATADSADGPVREVARLLVPPAELMVAPLAPPDRVTRRRVLAWLARREVLGGLPIVRARPAGEIEDAPAVAPTVAPPAEPAGHLGEGLRELREFAREVGGGRIGEAEVAGRQVYVPLVARDGERYTLRLGVGAYLAEPLRCGFVDEARRSTRAAWPYPADDGPFRSPAFICTPPTAEFYEFHSGRVYRPEEGTLTNAVATVFAALHAPEYAGRFTPGRQAR
jgi:hypothetical protein